MADARETGCLLIDDPLCDLGALDAVASALDGAGVRAETFHWDGRGQLYPALQRAYQSVRRDAAINGIAALGAGCDCALALACQLPADRLVLMEPMDWHDAGEAGRQLRRIRAFAHRNAVFCVADALILPGPHTGAGLLRRLRHDLGGGRVTLFEGGVELWSNRKEVLNLGIIHFLREGVLPKSLAENAEMCIIYG